MNKNHKKNEKDYANISEEPTEVMEIVEVDYEYTDSTSILFKIKKWPFITALIIAVVLVSGYLFETSYYHKFYPGVFIGGKYVGGETLAEAMSSFNEKAEVVRNNGLNITLVNQGKTKNISIPAYQPGLSSDNSFEYYSLGDWQKKVNDAYQFGRTGQIWQRLGQQMSLVFTKRFAMPATFYEMSVRSFISHELEDFIQKTVPAQFAINKKGQIYITSEVIGESVDMDAIINSIKSKVFSFDSMADTFTATIDPPLVTEDKLQQYLPLAKEISKNTSLFFHYQDHKWKISGTNFATWLTIKDGDQIGVDSEKLKTFLSKTVALVINDPPQNSRFEMQDGVLKEIFKGKSGSVVDIGKTAEKVEQIIPVVQRFYDSAEVNSDVKTRTFDILIEIIKEEPKITQKTIDQYHIHDLVGVSNTSFKGSHAERITNITIGTSQFNGTIIAPGEEFSAVNAIGYVTEEAGYQKEYVIKDNKSIKELGGGLCQIGTTLFRMALNAGLPITERVAHRYVVSYYGPGLDATIYGPHPDVRFVNDTGNYLLLQGRVEGTNLILELYGQKDGRQVLISEPVITNRIPAPPTQYIQTPDLAPGEESCSETPRAGMTTDVAYQVAYPSGEVNKQNFHSVYEPWHKICLVGAKN